MLRSKRTFVPSYPELRAFRAGSMLSAFGLQPASYAGPQPSGSAYRLPPPSPPPAPPHVCGEGGVASLPPLFFFLYVPCGYGRYVQKQISTAVDV